MASVTNMITIQRPIEDVFAVLTNVENTGKWFPGNVEEHWTSPPPHGVGSTRHAIATMFGRRTENDAVATEYQPPHRAAMQGTSPNAPILVTLIFVPDGDGTRVEVTSEITLRGAMRIFGPLVGALYGRAWARGLVKLQAVDGVGSAVGRGAWLRAAWRKRSSGCEPSRGRATSRSAARLSPSRRPRWV